MIDDFGFSSCDDVYDYESDDDPLSKTVDLSDETSAYYLLEETQNMVVSVTRELGDKIQNMTIKSTSFELGKR